MTAIETKMDALMNKLGKLDRRMHSMHEVGPIEGNEHKSVTDEGLAHEGPYHVEEAQFVGGNISYNFKPNNNLLTHQHRGTMKISYMEVEHNKAKDLCKTINNNTLHMGSKDSSSRTTREPRIRAKEGPSLLKNRC